MSNEELTAEQEDIWQQGFDVGFDEGYAQGRADLAEKLEEDLFEEEEKLQNSN